jgi:hypothetical protein
MLQIFVVNAEFVTAGHMNMNKSLGTGMLRPRTLRPIRFAPVQYVPLCYFPDVFTSLCV